MTRQVAVDCISLHTLQTKKLDISRHVSLALKNEVGGRKFLFSMLKDRTLFWL